MGARVDLHLRQADGTVLSTAALLNGGFEADEPHVKLSVLVSDAETEALVSDTAIDAFGIEIKSHGRGLWRFSDEDGLRESVPPQLW